MSNGDVLVELRAWRDEFAMAHRYDLREMAAALSQLDTAAGQKLVRGEPRRPVAARMPIQPLQPSGEGPPCLLLFDVVKGKWTAVCGSDPRFWHCKSRPWPRFGMG